jgi:hypothetical protein
MTRLFLLLSILFLLTGVAQAQPSVLLVTGDTEGHLGPCATCPNHSGRGGIDRRATAVAGQRDVGPVLLLDAGNWLVGGDSLGSNGGVMVAAYAQLKYDAVNLSTKDLFWGKEQTLHLLKDAKFTAVSATLLDAETGKPVLPPYVVVNRTAIIGLCELPPGQELLPHIQKQLAGIRLRPVAEALNESLPKAKAESDRVVVLYHGTGKGLRALRTKLAGTGVMIAAAGVSRENIPDDSAAPVIVSDRHGQTLAKASLADGKLTVEQVALTSDVPGDPAMQQLVASFAPPPPKSWAVTTATTLPTIAPATQPVVTAVAPPVESPAAVQPPPPQVVVPPPVAPPPPPPPAKPANPRVAARQPHQPKGLAGAGLTQEQVNTAIDRGCAFLWKVTQDQAKSNDGDLGGSYEGYHTLASLALVKSGLHKKDPEFNKRVRRYLARVVPESLGTYGAGTLCMLVEAYGDPQYEYVQRRAARYLFECQGGKGWDYNPKVPETALLDAKTTKPLQVWGGRKALGSGEAEHWNRASTQPSAEVEGDNSLAQYAVMGLQSAARAGVEVPQQTWQQVLEMYRTRQSDEGGWSYTAYKGASSTGSMTCAGAYSLTVARYFLGEKDPEVDDAVEQGIAWLDSHFTVTENPAQRSYHYYYLYALERLGRTLDTEFIGTHEWYPLGAKYLVDNQQADGSWHEDEPDRQPELTTSFALLFLSRGTPMLKPPIVHRDGPGMLKTALLQPPAPRVYFILDCSGSMTAEMNGKTKFDLARLAITQLLDELPEGTPIALRAYGHRKGALDEGASDDTELLMPLAPVDRQAVADTLAHLRARGKTPLARSLKEATNDVSRGEKIDVVLLTDGGEDTLPRQDPVAAAAALGRVKNVTLHIVGFDIGDETWGKQLHDMAAAAKGHYWPANDGDALIRDLRAALLHSPGTYEVLNDKGKPVTQGRFGDAKQLPPGQYTFVTTFSGQPLKEPFNINAGMPTVILFDSVRFDVTNTPTATQPATAARFCTSCGKRLEPGQKFCPSCGQKVAP